MKKTIKKNKIRLKPILICFFLIVLLYYAITFLLSIKIKNIYITGNTIISDKEIITLAGIDNYPSYYKTSSRKIKTKLLTNDYITDVSISKDLFWSITINITESIPLFVNAPSDKIILSNAKEIDNTTDIIGLPILINFVPDIVYGKLIKELANIKSNIRGEISEIKYDPNEYDENRFLLYMVDGNQIYINIPKFINLNYYDEIYPTLESKKGTLYLDSGNHFIAFDKK